MKIVQSVPLAGLSFLDAIAKNIFRLKVQLNGLITINLVHEFGGSHETWS